MYMSEQTVCVGAATGSTVDGKVHVAVVRESVMNHTVHAKAVAESMITCVVISIRTQVPAPPLIYLWKRKQ